MKGHILTSILTVLTLTGLQAQSLPATPKMVVGLTIDQLRTDYIEAFSSLYGEKGFKRLWKEGKVFLNAEYTFSNPDRSSAMAAIYTGTTPSFNGIISNYRLDISTLRTVSCVDDSNFLGYYTNDNSAPSQLLTSTVGDELKASTLGKGFVYAVAPFRDAAILGAGHSADGAFWMNDMTGKWAGTTYYSEFPWWANLYNDRNAVDSRIETMIWTPLHPEGSYKNITVERFNETFKYKFADAKQYKFKRLINSPFVNDEVNMLVDDLLKNTTIGEDDTPDFLSVTFYAGSYNNQSIQEGSVEIQDTYARLDKNIADLLEMVNKKVGLQNVIFFITSTGYTAPEGVDLGRFRIPGGEFYLNRCAALLNMYLMASYGEGHYVEGYYDQQIYLNHKLIEEKQLSLADVQTKSAEFLIQFSGVDEVFSANRLLLGAWSPDIQKKRNAFNRKYSGDLVISVLPGWTIVNENAQVNPVVRYAHSPMPLIFLGSSIKPEIIHTPVTVDHIAPTLAHFMRIRAPNACASTPLF
ncbi:alkaline phosphatase family protein [Bacteroides sp. 51]|uniref:alkaline phosphatase family protein n=1 Tax=Bacteroides sp. 51 TaxID=2302938 RepID=UPI0013D71036|nr:alkaline phosphatase family protein [Bacteroides sp. 51]NDV82394.1 alkaline phosphatase family protein [Bacteroides sp. 51]